MEVDSHSVLQVVLQFLLEQHLDCTAEALVRESSVHLPSLLASQSIVSALMADGKWLELLRLFTTSAVDPLLLVDLFAHIVHELCYLGEYPAAKVLVQESEPLGGFLRQHDAERFAVLEEMCMTDREALSDPKPLREELDMSPLFAKAAQPNRLLTLIGTALKNRPQTEGVYDAYMDSVGPVERTSPMVSVGPTFPLGLEFEAMQVIGIDDRQYLVTGDKTGFLHVRSLTTMELVTDEFPYQQDSSSMMVMDGPVASLSSHGISLLAQATTGELLLWDVPSGGIKRRFVVDEARCFSQLLLDATMAIGLVQKAAFVYSTKSGALLRKLSFERIVSSMALVDSFLIVGFKDGHLEVYDRSDNWSRQTLLFSSNAYTPVTAIAPEKGYAVVACGRTLKRLVYDAYKKEHAWGDESHTCQSHVSHLAVCRRFVYAVDDARGLTVFDAGAACKLISRSSAIVGDEGEHVLQMAATADQLLISVQNVDTQQSRLVTFV